MIQMMMLMLTSISTIMFLMMNHPLTMGLTLMIQTILICLLTGTMAKSFWFSYILFLIFLGGMLVLFIYVTSLASNEMFSTSFIQMIMIISSLMFITITILFLDHMTWINLMNNEIEEINNSQSMNHENYMNLNKLYSFPTNYLTILMINYLLITLVITVKITNIYQGPLRPSNN